MFRRGFTLLEVLVAGGVLFIVSSAVVGLSNSIIQGTGLNADRTETNRWAAEGLELVNKVRTDSVKKGGTDVNGEKIWFAPAAEVATYGWYEILENTTNQTWSLQPLLNTPITVHLPINQAIANSSASLHNQGVTGYRLICVEAYGAEDDMAGDDHIDCNRTPGSEPATRLNDGGRNSVTACQALDTYCNATEASLNRNQSVTAATTIIPPGNAVKVRSIIVWQDRNVFRTTELGTVMTNWKGSEQ